MKRDERRLIGLVHSHTGALLDAKTRGQEHAARYMLSISIRQLVRWADEQAATTGEVPQADGERGA